MRRAVKRRSNTRRMSRAAQRRQPVDRCDRARLVLDDKSGDAVIDDFGHRAAVVGNNRRSASHRLDHHEPERFRPVDRDQKSDRTAEKFRLLAVADLADELDERIALDHRPDQFVIIILVGAVDLGGDLQGNAASCCDLDRAVDALLGRDASKHGKIARLGRLRRQQVFRQAMMDGSQPVGLRNRPPLRIGDRDDGNFGESVEHRLMLGQIEAAMQRRQERRRLPVEQRERIVIEMEMQEVELLVVTFAADILQHHDMKRVGIAHGAVEAQGFRPGRFQLRRRLRVAARKKCDVMAERNQFFRDPGHHPLRAAIQFGWNRLGQRGNLRDAHFSVSCAYMGEVSPAQPGDMRERFRICEVP